MFCVLTGVVALQYKRKNRKYHSLVCIRLKNLKIKERKEVFTDLKIEIDFRIK